MLTMLSLLLIVLGAVLNRMANRYFHQQTLPTASNHSARRESLPHRLQRWPRQALAVVSYLLGFVLIIYGALQLLG